MLLTVRRGGLRLDSEMLLLLVVLHLLLLLLLGGRLDAGGRSSLGHRRCPFKGAAAVAMGLLQNPLLPRSLLTGGEGGLVVGGKKGLVRRRLPSCVQGLQKGKKVHSKMVTLEQQAARNPALSPG